MWQQECMFIHMHLCISLRPLTNRSQSDRLQIQVQRLANCYLEMLTQGFLDFFYCFGFFITPEQGCREEKFKPISRNCPCKVKKGNLENIPSRKFQWDLTGIQWIKHEFMEMNRKLIKMETVSYTNVNIIGILKITFIFCD